MAGHGTASVKWLEDLASRAQSRLGRSAPTGDGTDKLVYELEVHHLELQMQNDELLRSELDLANACDRFRSILAAAPIGFLVLDEAGCVRDANPLAAQVLKREKATLIGKHLQGFLTPSDADRLHLLLRDCFGTNAPHRLEVGTGVSARLQLHLVPVVEHEALEDRRCWVFMTESAKLPMGAEGSLLSAHARRPTAAQPRVGTIVTAMVASMGGLLSQEIALEIEQGGDTANVASQQELERVVFQLCLRAFEDTPLATGAVLRVSCRELVEESRGDESHSGTYLRLSMSCTTDAVVEAGRPALTALATIVERCSGFVDLPAERAPGCNRPIDVYLPVVAPEPGTGATAASAARPVLLLVDDDPMLLQAITRMLTLDKYEVIAASGGAEALAVAMSDQKIDVFMTDVRMPGMNGGELGRLMAKLRPDLPRLYMSGDLGGIILEEGATCLAKPFRPDRLLALLSEQLKGSASE